MLDITAHQFPRNLDGHPLLAWMGPDWVDYIAQALHAEFPELTRIGCTGRPQMYTGAREGGRVAWTRLAIPLQLLVGEQHLRGVGTFSGPDPREVGFELDTTPIQQMLAVLRETQLRVRDDLELQAEIAFDIAQLEDEVPVRGISGLFLPTGPLQELALSAGWGDAFLQLADRADAIVMVNEDSWACHICQEDAGSLSLSETDARRDVWDALETGRADLLHAIDPGLVPWWCPECRRSYCGDHFAGHPHPPA